MDGLLESYHWYGKRFESPEDVHPLVFSKRNRELTSVNPALLGPSLSLAKQGQMPRSAAVGKFFQFLLPLLGTSRSRARLRMTTYRGTPSATMIYDQLPINDVFRRIHAASVLGVMDYKGMPHPFFFILHRQSAPNPGSHQGRPHPARRDGAGPPRKFWRLSESVKPSSFHPCNSRGCS